jgi:hypothetical protein
MNDRSVFETQTSRGRFLRKLGTTLAIGIGATVLPARAFGRSVTYTCCQDLAFQHCQPQGCGTQNPVYWCFNPTCGGYCTGCVNGEPDCYDVVQPGCL